jgi:hypothetical protein
VLHCILEILEEVRLINKHDVSNTIFQDYTYYYFHILMQCQITFSVLMCLNNFNRLWLNLSASFLLISNLRTVSLNIRWFDIFSLLLATGFCFLLVVSLYCLDIPLLCFMWLSIKSIFVIFALCWLDICSINFNRLFFYLVIIFGKFNIFTFTAFTQYSFWSINFFVNVPFADINFIFVSCKGVLHLTL